MDSLAQGNVPFVYLFTNWQPASEQVMLDCCSPGSSGKSGCLSWCYMPNTTTDRPAVDKFASDFRACLKRETIHITGNDSYDGGLYVEMKRMPNVAEVIAPRFGVRGLLLVVLGVAVLPLIIA